MAINGDTRKECDPVLTSSHFVLPRVRVFSCRASISRALSGKKHLYSKPIGFLQLTLVTDSHELDYDMEVSPR